MISATFTARRAEGRSALVPYVTAGYPRRDSSVPVLEALAHAGADVIELGIPFSDPLADGPTIQSSSFKSLENGTTVRSVLDDLRAFRKKREIPVVLFTYLNPVFQAGIDDFLNAAADSGAQGLLVTDLPTGSDPAVESAIVDSKLDLIRLIAPTTTRDRFAEVAEGGSGFLYYISRTGVTGAQSGLREGLSGQVQTLRDAVDLPVAVGFGISTPEQAATVASAADGVVVGSALIQALDQGGIEGASEFLSSLRAAMDEATGTG